MSDTQPKFDRRTPTETITLRLDEETLVADNRADLSPSQIVEQRLVDLLKTSPLMVSQVQRWGRPSPR